MATAATVGTKGARAKGYPGQRGGLSKATRGFPANINVNPVGPKTPQLGKIGVPVPGALGGLSRAGMLALRGLGAVALPVGMLQDYYAYQGRIAANPGALPWINPNWTLDRDCSRTPSIGRKNQALGPCNFALAINSINDLTWPPPAQPAPVTQMAALTAVVGGTHRQWAQHYFRSAAPPDGAWTLTGATPEIPLGVLPIPAYVPGFIHVIDPLSVPVEAPMPVPRNLPVRFPRQRPNPNRAPSEQSQAGYEVGRLSLPARLPHTVTFANGKVMSRPPRFKPRRKDKSKKLLPTSRGGKAAMAIASGLLNVVTETKDIVDILYDALPRSVKTGVDKTPPLHTKLKLVLSNLDQVDFNEAIPNLIINEIEDRLVGFKEGLKVKAAEKGGLSRGYSLKGAENPFPVNVPN